MNQKIQLSSACLLTLGVTLSLSIHGWAGELAVTPAPPTPPPASHGILPLPDYTGDLMHRAYLLGDLGGARSSWAERGFTFNIDTYQYVQGVASGGVDQNSYYGGVVDWNVAFDFDRMGIIPGGLLQMQGVSRFGRSVNGISGAAIPVNTAATTPFTSDLNQSIGISLPSITYTQFLSKKFALLAGKVNTYPQANEFSGGNGQSQFWNLNLVAPVTPLLIIPYSTLAAGTIIKPSEDLTIELAVGTSTDVSTTTGFDNLDDGMMGLVKIWYQYKLGKLPGGIVEQFGYGFDNDFSRVNGRFHLGPNGLTPSKKDSTWFNTSSVWQYLWVEGDGSQRVDPTDGVQDLQGIGMFARFQFADQDTNPINYTVAGGLCAKGLIPKRDNDTMGIAFNYGELQDTRLGNLVGLDRSTSVWEFYYNIEVTPAVHLGLDAQVVDGFMPGADTAVVLGTQLQVRF